MILKNKIVLCVLMTSVFGFAQSTHAAPTVSSPYVTEGETVGKVSSEYKIKGDGKDDSWATEFEVSHGITSFWKAEVGVEYEDEGGSEDGEFTELTFENIFQLAPKGQYFVDPGLKIEYAHSLNSGADELAGQLLIAKTIGNFTNKSEFGIAREFDHDGKDGETTYNFAYGLYAPVSESVELGGEWHSNFGDTTDKFDKQDHKAGPVAFVKLTEKMKLETGALIGVSDATPDATLKAIVRYKF